MFFRNQEQIERICGIFRQNVILVTDTSYQRVVGGLKFVSVPPVENLVRYAQERRGYFVLQIQEIPAGDPLDGLFVLFVVGHHLVISGDTLDLDMLENLGGERFEFFGNVLPDMPWISRQRKSAIRRGDQCGTAGLEYAVNLPQKQGVILNVFDHLEADYEVIAIVFQPGQGRNIHGAELRIRILRLKPLDNGSDLVDGRET